jgi:hypothetical protein
MSWGLSAEEGRDELVAPYAPGFSQLPIQQDQMLLGLKADVLNYSLGWMAAEATTFSVSPYSLFR